MLDLAFLKRAYLRENYAEVTIIKKGRNDYTSIHFFKIILLNPSKSHCDKMIRHRQSQTPTDWIPKASSMMSVSTQVGSSSGSYNRGTVISPHSISLRELYF